MSDEKKTTSGVILKTKSSGKTYFIPQKVLDGFAVEHSSGLEMLNNTRPVEEHTAFSVDIDPNLARQAFIF